MNRFTYNLFQKYQPVQQPGTYIIKQFMPITFYAYPQLHKDVTGRSDVPTSLRLRNLHIKDNCND